MTQLGNEERIPLTPPIPRIVPTTETTTFPVKKEKFLALAEKITPTLKDASFGHSWEFDGYRRTTLFLLRPEQLGLGLTSHTVEFGLDFQPTQTIVSISTTIPQQLVLYRAFTRALALELISEIK